jgi:hypothetical protein
VLRDVGLIEMKEYTLPLWVVNELRGSKLSAIFNDTESIAMEESVNGFNTVARKVIGDFVIDLQLTGARASTSQVHQYLTITSLGNTLTM